MNVVVRWISPDSGSEPRVRRPIGTRANLGYPDKVSKLESEIESLFEGGVFPGAHIVAKSGTGNNKFDEKQDLSPVLHVGALSHESAFRLVAIFDKLARVIEHDPQGKAMVAEVDKRLQRGDVYNGITLGALMMMSAQEDESLPEEQAANLSRVKLSARNFIGKYLERDSISDTLDYSTRSHLKDVLTADNELDRLKAVQKLIESAGGIRNFQSRPFQDKVRSSLGFAADTVMDRIGEVVDSYISIDKVEAIKKLEVASEHRQALRDEYVKFQTLVANEFKQSVNKRTVYKIDDSLGLGLKDKYDALIDSFADLAKYRYFENPDLAKDRLKSIAEATLDISERIAQVRRQTSQYIQLKSLSVQKASLQIDLSLLDKPARDEAVKLWKKQVPSGTSLPASGVITLAVTNENVNDFGSLRRLADRWLGSNSSRSVQLGKYLDNVTSSISNAAKIVSPSLHESLTAMMNELSEDTEGDSSDAVLGLIADKLRKSMEGLIDKELRKPEDILSTAKESLTGMEQEFKFSKTFDDITAWDDFVNGDLKKLYTVENGTTLNEGALERYQALEAKIQEIRKLALNPDASSTLPASLQTPVAEVMEKLQKMQKRIVYLHFLNDLRDKKPEALASLGITTDYKADLAGLESRYPETSKRIGLYGNLLSERIRDLKSVHSFPEMEVQAKKFKEVLVGDDGLNNFFDMLNNHADSKIYSTAQELMMHLIDNFIRTFFLGRVDLSLLPEEAEDRKVFASNNRGFILGRLGHNMYELSEAEVKAKETHQS